MTDKQIIIDDYFTERTDEGRGTIGYYLIDDIALIKRIREQNKYIKAKEQECEELNKKLLKTFEEKDKLNLIIDRLLVAGCYDINTASAEAFEDVYENMRYEKQQLQKLEKIKEIVNMHKQNRCKACSEFDKCFGHPYCDEVILQIIKE